MAVILVIIVAGGLFLSVRRVPAYGGSLTVSLGDSSRFINPLLASTNTDSGVSTLVFPGLTVQSGDGSIGPGLADHWTVGDGGRLYTFRLRPHLRWQNGRAVTSSDVAYTYRLLAQPSFPTHNGIWTGVRVSAPNPATVVVRLPRTNYTFLQQSNVGIVPSQFAHSHWPVGAGGYRVSHVGSSMIQLTGDPQGASPPYIGHLSFVTGSASSSGLVCRPTLSPGSRAIQTTREIGLTFNLKALSDRSVRLALISAVGSSGSLTTSTPVPTWSPSTAPPALSRMHDARAFMRRAGWRLHHGRWTKHGKALIIRLAASNDPKLSALVFKIARLWRSKGFAVAVIRRPFPSLIRTILYPGAFTAAVLEWDFGGRDYDPGTFWSSGGPLNFGHLHDRSVDRLSARVLATPSMSGRNRLRADIGGAVISQGAAVGLTREGYVCRAPSNIRRYRVPSLVSDAGGILADEPRWYVQTKLVLRNPFSRDPFSHNPFSRNPF